MLVIKNNLMAANTARNLGRAYASLAQSVERLSSGLRINSARDDAAGLAVRELMRADIATLKQGKRNTLDGISMLQTMEGGMGAINSLLVRMKQLAEQASTGSYSARQRQIMNYEFAEMAKEIDRISEKTSFNGIKMLNKRTSGPRANQNSEISIHTGQGSIDIPKVAASQEGLDVEIEGRADINVWDDVSRYGKSVDTEQGREVEQTSFATLTFGIGSPMYGVDPYYSGEGSWGNGITIMIKFANTGAGTSEDWIAIPVITPEKVKFTIDELIVKINSQVGQDVVDKEWDGAKGRYYLNINAVDPGADQITYELVRYTVDNGLNLRTATAAKYALDKINTAIEQQNTDRASFGYYIRRLEAESHVLGIRTENLMAAESRISDVDVATEMAGMTRNQVLAQAGISMLSQANTLPRMALELLR